MSLSCRNSDPARIVLGFAFQGAAYCSVAKAAGQPAVVTAVAANPVVSGSSCQILVNFPAFGQPTLFATTTVYTIQLSSLVLRPQNYDFAQAQGNLTAVAVNTTAPADLQPIQCNTTDYEQVKLFANC